MTDVSAPYQVPSTTTSSDNVLGQDNLPFAWTSLHRLALKLTIDSGLETVGASLGCAVEFSGRITFDLERVSQH